MATSTNGIVCNGDLIDRTTQTLGYIDSNTYWSLLEEVQGYSLTTAERAAWRGICFTKQSIIYMNTGGGGSLLEFADWMAAQVSPFWTNVPDGGGISLFYADRLSRELSSHGGVTGNHLPTDVGGTYSDNQLVMYGDLSWTFLPTLTITLPRSISGYYLGFGDIGMVALFDLLNTTISGNTVTKSMTQGDWTELYNWFTRTYSDIGPVYLTTGLGTSIDEYELPDSGTIYAYPVSEIDTPYYLFTANDIGTAFSRLSEGRSYNLSLAAADTFFVNDSTNQVTVQRTSSSQTKSYNVYWNGVRTTQNVSIRNYSGLSSASITGGKLQVVIPAGTAAGTGTVKLRYSGGGVTKEITFTINITGTQTTQNTYIKSIKVIDNGANLNDIDFSGMRFRITDDNGGSQLYESGPMNGSFNGGIDLINYLSIPTLSPVVDSGKISLSFEFDLSNSPQNPVTGYNNRIDVTVWASNNPNDSITSSGDISSSNAEIINTIGIEPIDIDNSIWSIDQSVATAGNPYIYIALVFTTY